MITNGSTPGLANALDDDNDEDDHVEPHTINDRGISTVRILNDPANERHLHKLTSIFFPERRSTFQVEGLTRRSG